MNKGVWYGVAAYGLWGILPLYWHLLHNVPALEIVAHRLVWSLIFLGAIVTIRKEWAGLKGAFNRRTLLIYAGASILLSINWLVYIWSVNAGFVVESSLGYFINPLVSVLLGVIFLGERLPVSKWIPIGLAAVGVAYLTITYGGLPWIALALAFSFAFYGLVKKLSPLGSLHGLILETAIASIPSLAYLLVLGGQGSGSFGAAPWWVSALLMLCGVITAVPLLAFSAAARSIPLTTLGLLQYLSPTLQFLIGVFVFGEAFTTQKLIGFSIIWAALILFSLVGMVGRGRIQSAAPAD